MYCVPLWRSWLDTLQVQTRHVSQVEKRELLPHFFYMTEGTEKSPYGNKDYISKTMRDGGNKAWNMSSNH